MNIFVLDRDPAVAARYHHDRHVVKMTLEMAQMLSATCTNLECYAPRLYKPTHRNHPCVRWLAAGRQNLDWAVAYGRALAAEYTHRYGKTHASATVIEAAADLLTDCKYLIPRGTPFAQAMPDEFKRADAVEAYRAYYIAKKIDNQHWTNRQRPEWLP